MIQHQKRKSQSNPILRYLANQMFRWTELYSWRSGKMEKPCPQQVTHIPNFCFPFHSLGKGNNFALEGTSKWMGFPVISAVCLKSEGWFPGMCSSGPRLLLRWVPDYLHAFARCQEAEVTPSDPGRRWRQLLLHLPLPLALSRLCQSSHSISALSSQVYPFVVPKNFPY